MKTFLASLSALLFAFSLSAQDGRLTADGNDEGTYRLIKESGYFYETPDASGAHANAPFRHITQSWDEELGKHVFNFILHIDNDDDRGKSNIRDRQRNEIKTDNKSPESMKAREGETLRMCWKFRLPEGMMTTRRFAHIHQLKGTDNKEGTADVGHPVLTFTVRSMSNGKQQFQIIYTGRGNSENENLGKVDLSEFLGQWVSVEETVTFAQDGRYRVRITRISDGKTLADIDVQRDFWRDGAVVMRPKWGLYRSFGKDRSNASELRDETLKFADFSVEKI